jgi:hypothetical protein
MKKSSTNLDAYRKLKNKANYLNDLFVFFLFIPCLIFHTIFCVSTSLATPPPLKPEANPKGHKPSSTKHNLEKIIQERLKSDSERRETIRRAVQPPKVKKKRIAPGDTFTLTMPFYAAMVDTIQEKSLSALEKTIKKLRSKGVNALVIRMYQNHWQPYHRLSRKLVPVGVYYKSHFAPLVDDLLTPIVNLARRYNMRIFVRISSRRCDWASERNPQWQDTGFDPVTGEELVPILGLNLFNYHVRYYLINLFRELAQYPIDGIVLSDDFSLGPVEGYAQESLAEFSMESQQKNISNDIKKWFGNLIPGIGGGYYIDKFPEFLVQFFKWRSRKLGEFAAEIVKNIRLVDPTMGVGLTLKSDFLRPKFTEKVLTSLSLDLDEMVKANFDYYFVLFNSEEFFENYPEEETCYKGLTYTDRHMKKKVQTKLLWVFPSKRKQKNQKEHENMIYNLLQSVDLGGTVAYQPYNIPFSPSTIDKFLPAENSPE